MKRVTGITCSKLMVFTDYFDSLHAKYGVLEYKLRGLHKIVLYVLAIRGPRSRISPFSHNFYFYNFKTPPHDSINR